MFTSSNSGNNRLLALEQELMGWKNSPKAQREQHEQDENSMPDSEAEAEEVAAQDSEIEETEELEEVEEVEQISYAGLAEMLQNNANLQFKRNVTQLQAKRDGLLLPQQEETVFEYPSRRDTFPPGPIISDRNAVSAFQFSQLPELDLPTSDRAALSFPDITLPEAEEYTPSPVSSSSFSGDEPSYTSLLQVLQSVRQSDRAPDELEATIDVESHAIAQEQGRSNPPSTQISLASSIEQPLLSATRSTDAIALVLESIELEPISDEEEDDW
jgi:hypothetical protein